MVQSDEKVSPDAVTEKILHPISFVETDTKGQAGHGGSF